MSKEILSLPLALYSKIFHKFEKVKNSLHKRLNGRINGRIPVCLWAKTHAARTFCSHDHTDLHGNTEHHTHKHEYINYCSTVSAACCVSLTLRSLGSEVSKQQHHPRLSTRRQITQRHKAPDLFRGRGRRGCSVYFTPWHKMSIRFYSHHVRKYSDPLVGFGNNTHKCVWPRPKLQNPHCCARKVGELSRNEWGRINYLLSRAWPGTSCEWGSVYEEK